MSFYLGIGARSGVLITELEQAVAALELTEVAGVGTLDRRGFLMEAFAAGRGWPLLLFSQAELAQVRTPGVVLRTGAPSVAEASALLAAGPGARLVVPKRPFARVTVAVAERSL
ncbi:cobalamin biosynthesis protein [Actinoplanes sp. TFC3]|uniref:cobalamin biosynthesis protein n=1 Tax=Actinoplanes sp. TFC3 TaxID=1710355 RepID=UPI000ADB59F9|nr:cobalamin biosynthesis protein [Actinoplanes sp. TFC3]